MRINKYLKDKGYTTRRGADDLINKGSVYVNGKTCRYWSRNRPKRQNRDSLGPKVSAKKTVLTLHIINQLGF